jgi:uncharacterized protein (DUF427 family)
MFRKKKKIEPGPGQESVWDYPRPPRLESTDKHIIVEIAGETIVDTDHPKRVLETSHPPVYYFDPIDVRMDFAREVFGSTFCEWKGMASYLDFELGERRVERAAWFYPNPTRAFAEIKNWIALYPSKMDKCTVNGEVVTAQAGDFYGGWITADIVGPFKGEPGTGFW